MENLLGDIASPLNDGGKDTGTPIAVKHIYIIVYKKLKQY